MKLRYQIVFWRDIPAQIKVRAGKERLGRPLSARFQVAIDEAAMRADLTGTDAYLEEWRSGPWQEGEGDPEEILEMLCAQYEAGYPIERLKLIVGNDGKDK